MLYEDKNLVPFIQEAGESGEPAFFRHIQFLCKTNATATKVKVSATGMKNGSAYSPQSIDSRMGKLTPKTISRVRDNAEDCFACPSD